MASNIPSSTVSSVMPCVSYTHTPLLHGANVTTNPDITGPAMLAAFFVTATTSVVAVLFSYILGALEDSSQNFIDFRARDCLRELWYRLHPSRRQRQDSVTSTRSLANTRNYRKEGIIQFVLVLSDQQLVTGIAVLIPPLVNLSAYNRYELIMIHSLAWFSATTHLATLDTLAQYLEGHTKVRAARTAGVAVFLALFSSVFVMRALSAMSGNEMQSSASCPIIQWPPDVALNSNWHGLFNRVWQASWIMVLFLVDLGYLIRLQALFYHERHPFYVFGWILWSISVLNSKHETYGEMYAARKAALRYQRIIWVSGCNGQKRWVPFGYDDSFLSSIPGIVFSFSYAISQLASVSVGMNIKFEDQESRLGFGQIVSLLLLCLPFTAAGASISDYKKRQNREYEEGLREIEMGQVSNATIGSNLRERLHDQNIEHIETLYDEELPRLRQYFYRHVKIIAEEGFGKERSHMSLYKQSLLNGLEAVERRESEISIVPHIVWFGIQACGALALGALLNAASFDAAGEDEKPGVLVAIALLFAFLSAKLIILTYEFVAILRMKS